MKIVHIFWGLGTGGIETMLVNIANEQVKLGHKVYIIIINDLVNEMLRNRLSSDVCFICLGRKLKSKSPWFVVSLNLCLMRIAPDVIHSHKCEIKKIILPLWQKRCVLTVHDVLRSSFNKDYSWYKKVYAISDSVRDDLKRIQGIDVKTIFNGISIEVFRQRKERKDIVNIVQVSRITHEKKGQDILLKAFANLVNEGYNTLTLTFVGEGESESFLKNMANELGVADCVHFAGLWQQDYLFEHLADFDLFVQPSRYEGFGLTVAEAIAAKVPVLVSANQGPMEIIDQGKYGYSFANDDVNDCTNKLRSIVQNGCDLEMMNKGYYFICQNFDVCETARKYIEEYKRIF